MRELTSTISGIIEKGIITPGSDIYDAFIPIKLCSNQIPFDIDSYFLELLQKLNRNIGELNGLCKIIDKEVIDLIVAHFLLKEGVLSSNIYGTQSTITDVIGLDTKQGCLRPIEETCNHIRALEYCFSAVQEDGDVLRADFIHSLHKILLDGQRGQEDTPGVFKNLPNRIGVAGCNFKEADFVPPPPHLVNDLMADFFTYYHNYYSDCETINHYPDLVKIAILHYQFETIHPYNDGNGRMGRVLIPFMLWDKEILDKPVLVTSLFFKQNKEEYEDKLMNVRFKGEWKEWIDFFITGMINLSSHTVEIIRQIIELQKEHKKLIQQNIVSKYSLDIYDLICKSPKFSVTKIIEDLKNIKDIEVTYSQVKVLLDKFLDLNIVVKGEDTPFVYEEYLSILAKDN